jgi:hypothetical protein
MMELKIFARNKSGGEVAALTMTVPMLDVNSVMSQFKVLVAPTDADNYEMAVQGLLTPHRKNMDVPRALEALVAPHPDTEPLSDDDARAIATRFAPKQARSGRE